MYLFIFSISENWFKYSLIICLNKIVYLFCFFFIFILLMSSLNVLLLTYNKILELKLHYWP